MSPHLATIVCAFVILGLFLLERDRGVRTSKALWIPTVWVLIAASRMVSGWLQTAPQIQTADQYVDGSPLDRFILGALLAAAIVVLLCRGRRVSAILRMNWPILLFFSYCVVSTLWSDYPDVAFKRWMKALGDLVMVLIVLTDHDRSAAIKRLLARVGFLLVPLSVLFIEYYPHLGQVYSPEEGISVYTGVTMNKNTLGRLCLVIGLASAWRLVSLFRDNFHRIRHWVAHGAVLAMVLWLLWMANSATSTASFLLGLAVIVFVSLPGKRRRARVLLLIGGMASIALLVFVLPDVYAFVVQALGRSTTLTGRTKLWDALLSMHTNPWIGTGFTSFWLGGRLEKIWSLYGWQPNEAHNGYLEIYLNLGWIGLTMLALFLAAGYRNVVATLRRDPEAGSLRLGFFVVALAYNFTESAFRMMIPVWIFLLWAVIAVPQPLYHEGSIDSAAEDPEAFQYDLAVVRTGTHEEIV